MKAKYSGAATAKLSQLFAKNGIKYGLSVGRRQPMHAGHLACILDIVKAGLIPVLFIGSANDKGSKYYDPLKNPLTIEEQAEQIRLTMAKNNITNYHIIPIADVGDMKKWTNKIVQLTDKELGKGAHKKSVFHFIGKATDDDGKKDIKPLHSYIEEFAAKGVASWQSVNRDKDLYKLNSTTYREMDVKSKEFTQLSAGEYIKNLAIKARENNGFTEILEQLDTPVTMRDITLLRLSKDHGITPETLLSA